eukprot:gene43950-53734_t
MSKKNYDKEEPAAMRHSAVEEVVQAVQQMLSEMRSFFETKLNAVETKLDAVETKLDAVAATLHNKLDNVVVRLQTLEDRLSEVEGTLDALPVLLASSGNDNATTGYFGTPMNSSSTEDPFKNLYSTLLAQGEDRPDKVLQIELCPTSETISTTASELTESSLKALFEREPPCPIRCTKLMEDGLLGWCEEDKLILNQAEQFFSQLQILAHGSETKQQHAILKNVTSNIKLFQLMLLADTHATNSGIPALKALSQEEGSKKGKPDLFCLAYPQDLELKD